MGDTPVDGTSILAPVPADSVSYDTGKLFILSVARESGENLLVSSQWEVNTQVDLSTKALKEEFPKSFVKLLPPSSTLQSVRFVQRYFRGYAVPDTLGYAYADTVRLNSLWVDPTFVGMVKALQGVDVLSVIITMKGWKDTTLTPVYDDPAADNRALYKIPIQLVPGVNEVHFAPGGRRERRRRRSPRATTMRRWRRSTGLRASITRSSSRVVRPATRGSPRPTAAPR